MTSPILIKAALMAGAIPQGPLRLPLVEATGEERRELARVLESVEVLVNAS